MIVDFKENVDLHLHLKHKDELQALNTNSIPLLDIEIEHQKKD